MTEGNESKNLAQAESFYKKFERESQEDGSGETVSETESFLDSSEDEDRARSQKRPIEKRFSWIIPLVAMIPLLVSLLPRIIDKLPQHASHYIFEFVENEFSRFEWVMAVASARDLKTGEKLQISDLKTIIVKRDTLPENAVSPMHVDQLIGQVLIQPIDKGQIIVLEGVADNK